VVKICSWVNYFIKSCFDGLTVHFLSLVNGRVVKGKMLKGKRLKGKRLKGNAIPLQAWTGP
jgi:hypothetical protein